MFGSHVAMLAAAGAAALLALSFVAYVFWPHALIVAPDAPSLPITVAGETFNVPPAMIRVPLQRQPGMHERLDLALLWPSLEPPDPATKPAPTDEPTVLDRMFITIQAADTTMTPAERLKSLYPRYVTNVPVTGPNGLRMLPFREGTPYQGEDLVFYPPAPEKFVLRCSRAGAGVTPGICLMEQRIGAADMIVRFPRDWLDDWQGVARGIDRLVASLRPVVR